MTNVVGYVWEVISDVIDWVITLALAWLVVLVGVHCFVTYHNAKVIDKSPEILGIKMVKNESIELIHFELDGVVLYELNWLVDNDH